VAWKNQGGGGGPVWKPTLGWDVAGVGDASRPALARGTGDSHLVASLDASMAEGGAPLHVELDASASRAASGASLTYQWDFGDGTTKLTRSGGAIPTPLSMFTTIAPEMVAAGSIVAHVYTRRGTFVAKVMVSDGVENAEASVTITVDGDGLPDAPGGPDDDAEASQGFGANTPGGAGGTVLHVTHASRMPSA